jgi:hypothetical protein
MNPLPKLSATARLYILCETLFLFSLVLWSVWFTHLNSNFYWLTYLLSAVLFYAALASPLLHRQLARSSVTGFVSASDFFWHQRGLGSPLAFFFPLQGSPPGIRQYRGQLLVTLLLLTVLFSITVFEQQAWFTDKLGLPSLSFTATAVIVVPVLLTGSLLLLSFMNHWQSYRAALQASARAGVIGLLIIGMLFLLLSLIPALPLTTPATPVQKWQGFSLLEALSRCSGYIVWAWLQQFFFLGVINTNLRLAINTSDRRHSHAVALLTALLFALVHLPNLWLFLFTFVVEILLVYGFMRYGNLFAIALVHALMAVLYHELLPLSLAPDIRGFDGPPGIYFGSRLFVFLVLPASLLILLYLHGRYLRWLKTIIMLVFGSFLLLFYPNSSDGPFFNAGETGNFRSWRLHDLSTAQYGKDFTDFTSTGQDAYLMSQPLSVRHGNNIQVEFDMLVTDPVAGDMAVVYTDLGEGFNKGPYAQVALKNGKHSYSIRLALPERLFRLRLDPSLHAQTQIRLYSLRILPDTE